MLYYNLLPYQWNFKGKTEKIMNILFVCTGNSCRSPMAEAYFNMLAERDRRDDFAADSAGIHTFDGCSASMQAQIVAKSFGGDLSSFRSTRFEKRMANDYDLIIAMTCGHRAALLEIAPGAPVKLLMDFAGLEYLSSAGLRVILSAQKTMNKQGEMVIRNVNETINEVFEITGFIDILTIE